MAVITMLAAGAVPARAGRPPVQPPAPPVGKQVPAGLANRHGTLDLPSTVIEISREITWAEIEARKGVYDLDAIDALVRAASAAGKKVLLRVVGGQEAPGWLKAELGVVTIPDVEVPGELLTIAAFWKPAYLRYLARLYDVLGTAYDANPAVVGVQWAGVNEKHGEPMVSWPGNSRAYLDAGYTWEAHRTNLIGMATAVASAFPHTPVVAAVNMLSRPDDVLMPLLDRRALIEEVVAATFAAGAPAVVLQNHGLGRPVLNREERLTHHGLLWEWLVELRDADRRVSLAGQTMSSRQLVGRAGHGSALDGLRWSMQRAVDLHLVFVELPYDVSRYTSDAEIATWASRVRGAQQSPPGRPPPSSPGATPRVLTEDEGRLVGWVFGDGGVEIESPGGEWMIGILDTNLPGAARAVLLETLAELDADGSALVEHHLRIPVGPGQVRYRFRVDAWRALLGVPPAGASTEIHDGDLDPYRWSMAGRRGAAGALLDAEGSSDGLVGDDPNATRTSFMVALWESIGAHPVREGTKVRIPPSDYPLAAGLPWSVPGRVPGGPYPPP
jgi:hypothetical protein